MDKTLEDLRKEINEVDEILFKTLEKRFEITQEVGLLKLKEGIAVNNTKREQEILEKIKSEKVREVYVELFRISKKYQQLIIDESNKS